MGTTVGERGISLPGIGKGSRTIIESGLLIKHAVGSATKPIFATDDMNIDKTIDNE